MGNMPLHCNNINQTLNETSYRTLSECWIEWTISEFLRLNLPLIILPISLISNCLTFCALRSHHMRGTATTFFMLVLSVLDPLVLLTKNLVYFPRFVANYSITCKLLYFLIYVVGYTNVWILVIMTADKVFAVWFPLKVAYFCTITRAKYVCVLLLAVTSIISFHHFWTITNVKLPKQPELRACYYDAERYGSLLRLWVYIDFVIWCFLPFILILILSILIIYKLRQKRNSARQANIKLLISYGKSTEVNNGKHANANKTTQHTIEVRSTQKRKDLRSRHRHITFMLLAVACVFLLLTLPNSIYFVLESIYNFGKEPTVNDYYQWLRYRRLKILTVLMFQLSDLQHATNFFIYLLASGKFRRSVLHTCKSILYIFPLSSNCSNPSRTNSKCHSTKRFDRDKSDTMNRSSAANQSYSIRHQHDISIKHKRIKPSNIPNESTLEQTINGELLTEHKRDIS